MAGEKTYLDATARAALVMGEQVVYGHGFMFTVVSSPGDRGHPVFMPPPSLSLVGFTPDLLYLDRRRR